MYDKNLSPKQNYTYKAYYTIGGTVHDSSAPLLITTMDTTSHEFTWEIDTLGNGNGSILSDVFILNDTCVYVVGEINIKDTDGNWITPPFNLARWNGNSWNYERSNAPGFLYWELYTIFAFDTNDIWAGSTVPEHWDGKKWTFYGVGQGFPTGFYINKILGTSSSNLYIVGYGGNLVHYNGITWSKIESGTDVNLTDVWGSLDGSVVWACGYYPTKAGTFLLKCINNSWSIVVDGTELENDIMEDSLSGVYSSVYTPSKLRLYVGSSAGLYYTHATTQGEGKRYSFTDTWFPGFPNSLRGNGVNDMVIVGDYSMLAHFNGITCKYFRELRTQDIALYAVAQKGDLIVAVGELYHPFNSKGIVFWGRR